MLYVLQGLLVPLLSLFTLAVAFMIPFHWIRNGMEPTAEYAALHPWRVHAASFAFTACKVATVLVSSGLVLWLLIWVLAQFPILNPSVLVIEFALILLSAFNNAIRGGKSNWNTLSHRLKGGTSTLTYSHAGTVPDEILGPITVAHHGW